jgi:HEAT repeat protein
MKHLSRLVILAAFFSAGCSSRVALPPGGVPESIADPLREYIITAYEGTPARRIKALRRIGSLGAKGREAGDYLLPLLRDKRELGEQTVRDYAALTLGDIGYEKAVPALVTILSERRRVPDYAAARALALLGRPAVDRLTSLLSHKRSAVRDGAIEALAAMDREIVAGLIPLMTDAEVNTAVSLLRVFRKNECRRTYPAVRAACRDQRAPVRAEALETITRLFPDRAYSYHLRALEDPVPRVRWQAAWGLGQLGDRRAVPYLTPLLEDRVDNVRAVVCRSLRLLKAVSAREAVEAQLERDGAAPLLLRQAAETLAAFRDTRSCPGIGKLLDHPRREVRQTARKALHTLSGRSFDNTAEWREWIQTQESP